MSGAFDLPDRRQVLASAAAATAIAVGPTLFSAPAEAAPLRPTGRGQPFDTGWRFHKGAGEGFEAPGLDDAGWRGLDLPHDWSIEDLAPGPGIVGPFDRKAEGGTATGFTVGGEGWYRKTFQIAPPAGGRVEIAFDGVYMGSDVWLNGHHLGTHPNGYTAFAYDLTPYLSATGDNVLAVRVRNLGRNSRWYSGSGIHRHVWLDVLPEPARIARWGVGVSTRRVAGGGADLDVATTLEQAGAGLVLSSRITDASGRVVWQGSAPASAEVRQPARVRAPRLWSPDSPALYTLETELRRGATVLDRRETPFGIRIATFDVATGMTLNGTPIKLRGGCIHHDNGLLGAAAFDAAEERKVVLLKARGFNAVRPSHNPFSPAFLAACDRHGLMVIAETFDAWFAGKLPQDYAAVFADWWRADLATIVASQRNHPSIILWSIGNEIPRRNLPEGIETQWQLAQAVHRIDPTRPVTAAVNDFAGRLVTPGAQTARPGHADVPDQSSFVFLDVAGYNYKLRTYESDHRQFPQRTIYGSESFPRDIFATWELAERSPWLLGDFVWTGMDYLGEAGLGGSTYVSAASAGGMGSLGSWPWVVASCGDIDLTGRQKGASLARDVVWGLSPLEVCVQKPVPEGKVEQVRLWGWSDERPSWTWPGAEGRTLAIRVYTAGDRVELRLNGHRLESRAVTPADRKQVELKAAYAPGVLEVVAYAGSRMIARRTLATAGAPAAIAVRPERPGGGAGRGDVSFVPIEVVDTHGAPAGDVEVDLHLALDGPAELVGFGAGGPLAVGGFQSATARSWDGRALAILRGTGRAGPVRIEVSGSGLRPGTAVMRMG